ncbi:LacI family DNA-binding transcriptional regulator [Propionibacterium australiense]|uniref:HTH_LacI n=1 Tax=Propionibacterium australiense TaxID=119981 RepID=A0A383S2B4_9ACTN|nr:LacI family DNA-binding transcriptional regulator [Propionibacterium australiense]RLP11471.1 LacI family DNA-binding transcriptional regulator [Propionibacterium australiense]RLP12792.1 LacI family DNA-binding transcriptional regulator [Propionibacterium australiense]SYZ32168.1 HTH_LacI [Propionibacterium australiense]VEH90762.1 Catabolite control protein [Propionibacterium australiense]
MGTSGQDVTQDDVARAAGVSRSLVSLALNGSPKVAEETRRRIAETAARLGYRVNAAAASLARQRSRTIGLVLPNLRNAFFEQIAHTLGDATSARDLALFVTVGSEQPEVLHRAIESLLSVRVMGLILVSPWLSDEDLIAIGEEVPVCLIGRRSPGGRVDSVRVDEQAAARLLIGHLTELDMRSVGYVGPRVVNDTSRFERESALRRAALAAGLTLDVHECGEDAGPAVRDMLSSHPEPLGLVVHNDILAIDAVPVLRETNRHPGSDIALVSYDNTYLARRGEFSLTSIDQLEDVLGTTAVRLLCERADDGATAPPRSPRDVVLEPALAIRGSSCPGRERLTP